MAGRDSGNSIVRNRNEGMFCLRSVHQPTRVEEGEVDRARPATGQAQGDVCCSSKPACRGSDGRGNGSGSIGEAWIKAGRMAEAAMGAKVEVAGESMGTRQRGAVVAEA